MVQVFWGPLQACVVTFKNFLISSLPVHVEGNLDASSVIRVITKTCSDLSLIHLIAKAIFIVSSLYLWLLEHSNRL
jgi:hypothetical protein